MPDDLPATGLPRLLAIMVRLREPGRGCPWDLAQDFASVAPYTIEEAHEVADAIAEGDMNALRGELGDLLFQVVFHARMAEEAGAFAFADVVEAINAKMLARHPHVFGPDAASAAPLAPERQQDEWERLKAAERQGAGEAGALAGVARSLPALSRAVKLQARAARVGFDWPSTGPVLAKLAEELAELEEARARQDAAGVFEEFGDLLFVIANLARHLHLDPEAALRAANGKFTRRFAFIEAALAAQGRRPQDSSLAEMEAHWNAAKSAERSGA